MTPDYIIILPVINRPDLVDTCIESFDIDTRQHLVMVDNSIGGKFVRYRDRCFQYIQPSSNLGVGPSFNIGMKMGHEWTILHSVALRWGAGISKFIEQLPTDPTHLLACLQINGVAPCWHCLGVRKRCVELLGYFDENFFPAYFEDTDMGYRKHLTGKLLNDASLFREHKVEVPTAENRGFALSVGEQDIPESNPINSVRNPAYYTAKWGGYAGKETFTTPFNSGKPISYWDFNNEFAPAHTKEQK